MGASRYVALYRTKLAHVLVAQGRDEDAIAELDQVPDTYDDLAWKTARARVLARGGQTAEAVSLGREALAAIADSDNIPAHAGILAHFAELLSADGDQAGAADALAKAGALHEEKGNVLPAERCRLRLAALATAASPATPRSARGRTA